MIGGILILPVIAIVAILIYLDSPGPIVFGHKRVGQGARNSLVTNSVPWCLMHKRLWKFILKENPEAREEWERDFKLKDDPRVTKNR